MTYPGPVPPPQPMPPPGAMPPWVLREIYQTNTAVVLPPNGYGASFTPAPGQVVQAFAGAGRRLAARLIDGLCMMALAIPLIAVLVITEPPPAVTSLVVIVIILWLLTYDPVLTCIYGGGVGKMALGIRVVRAYDTHRTPHFGSALGRWSFYFLLPYVPYAGIFVGLLDPLWLLWDRPCRQCLHDKAAGTIVIRTNEYRGYEYPA